MYEHEFYAGHGIVHPRVDVYNVGEDGNRADWLGALIKGDDGLLRQAGEIPEEMRRNLEEMLK